MDIIIGIGEYGISNNSNDVLKTFALASCVAVTFYCKTNKVSGMIHIALPSSSGSKYIDKPSYYASIGIPLIVNELTIKYGCLKSNISAQLFGGANSINKNDYFNIGEKNINMARYILNELGITVKNINVGGLVSRSIQMDVQTGNIKVSTQPIKI